MSETPIREPWPQIGARIRSLREAAGLSQEQLAAPELSASYLSRIEAGARPASQRVLAILAPRLGVSAEQLLSGKDPQVSDRLRLEVRTVLFELAQGDADAAAERLKGLSEHGQGPLFAAELNAASAKVAEAQGRLEHALEAWELAVANSAPFSAEWFEAAISVVRTNRLVGDLQRSIQAGEAFLEQVEAASLEDTTESVRLLLTLSGSHHEQGDVVHAARLARTALRRAERGADPRALASAYWNNSLILADRGDVREALTMAERAVAMFSEHGARRELAMTRVVYAQMLVKTGDADKALGLLDTAESELEMVGTASDLAYCVREQSRAALATGRPSDAIDLADRALAKLGSGSRIQVADAYLLRGRAQLDLGQRAEANDSLQAAAVHLAAIGAHRQAAHAWAELGECLDGVGDVAASRDAFRAASACMGVTVSAGSVTAAAIAITRAIG